MKTPRKTGFCWMVIASLYLFGIPESGTHLVHEVNICTEEHEFRCSSGDRISITELVCGSRSGCTQTVNKTVFSLCQGQQTCSNLNIGQLLTSQCKQNVTVNGLLRVKFKCLPAIAGASTLCRSNICTNSSQGMTCPEGSLVHIGGLTCGSLTGKCSLSTYTSVYNTCEGVNRCETSGLKPLLSTNCQNEIDWKRNIFVEYICVPASLIVKSCTPGKLMTMDRHFGVIKSPSVDPIRLDRATSCRWHITPAGFSRIKIIVHLVSTTTTQDGCDSRTLSLTTVECSNGTVVTSWFCQATSSGTEVVSCGDVWIRSSSPQKQESPDTFIVTYQRYNSLDTNTTPDDLLNCIAPQAISPPTTAATAHPSKYTFVSTHVPQHPSPKLSVGRNYGPGDGIFEYRDSLYDEESAGVNNREDTNILSKQLRLLVLYIFFGVVILVLVIALVAVIVSYHRISKYKGQGADSGEKTALWQQHEDTAMETFLNRDFVASSGTQETACAQTVDYQTGQIVATVHHEATSERATTEPQCSSGSGIPMFTTDKNGTDIKDKTQRFLPCSFMLSADQGNASNSDKKNENSKTDTCNSVAAMGAGHYKTEICDSFETKEAERYKTENCDSIETQGTCYSNMPSDSYNGIYEMLDFNVSNYNFNNDSKELPSPELEVPSDKSHEDKLYEVANYDSSVVGHPKCSSSDPHCYVSNVDCAVVSRTGQSTKASDTASPGVQLNMKCMDSGPSV